MRSWLTLGAVLFAAYGGLGLSACAESVFVEGGAPEDGADLGRPDLGRPMDMGNDDTGTPDSGPPDLGPVDMGPDLGPCNGAPTCCGDNIVQASEECEPGLPVGNPDRCPVNPGSDCDQSGPVEMCIEGNNCLRRCVPKDGLNPALICP